MSCPECESKYLVCRSCGCNFEEKLSGKYFISYQWRRSGELTWESVRGRLFITDESTPWTPLVVMG